VSGSSNDPTDEPNYVERESDWAFDTTVSRITQAIEGAGMRIFAIIDHALNAREAGLSMPPATVLTYGRAEGGTPIMMQYPRIALDLPLQVLVREDPGGKVFVSFYAITPRLTRAGVPAALAMRLQPAQDLILKALKP
jgi:uncharacterized protein (DUF302 family)